MVILTTTRDQVRVGLAARRAGGYSELIRLDREKRRAGPGAVLKRKNGRLYYERANPPIVTLKASKRRLGWRRMVRRWLIALLGLI
ncbi:hypothetical protein EIB18_03255 [Caulobacter vibrioides]|uniref:Uncharacterized protein n=2 Tax=Caulobacter vibrioides TaxID=155892 RepID=Q9AAJ1_CAUVC|nr:hypothetical protein [Caulobacter vibrioides]YP_002516015.1 hypothetical protein CCNA_00642 [Caulobacter vibrioides NA1000]AAK22592.1 hypothetical protein CC_0606 [Caulobacter vibrioides CB15]ACL94107.1 hypothetical protein CCNA_00642 [Caulobacter vibrioides NA1000]ATC27451.1 hypothetical protein CA607_03240 [Caulobacter vibrioides]AZH11828.1 hypothetical protein EIB18_03255 [Caulobacter vibrioides]QXZ52688.1 hypothetical protein KZH45_03135 [Caulobacter vibrioides]